ncbi:MAG: hypothetical protein CMH83_13450 [Nocardioides sp.]|nr:hypothetical protein [Nocardioides sp.]
MIGTSHGVFWHLSQFQFGGDVVKQLIQFLFLDGDFIIGNARSDQDKSRIVIEPIRFLCHHHLLFQFR